METKYYKKVFIKTEADLPKENKIYIVHIKDEIVQAFKYDNNETNFWLSDIDWYLQPTEAYPKEFVEWYGHVCIELHGQYGKFKLPENISELDTIDKIYEHWLNNVKGK